MYEHRSGAPPVRRVLYVNHTAEMSGAEWSLLTLLKALPSDIEPMLLAPDGPLTEEATAAGVPTVRMPTTAASLRLHLLETPRSVSELLRQAGVIRKEARRHSADLVHANTLRAGLAACAARRRGAPAVVVHVRDCLPPGLVASLILRLVGGDASVLIANSNYTARQNAPRVRRDDFVVAPSPIDLSIFGPDGPSRSEARDRIGLPPDAFLNGIVGQITPWKGIDIAIRALALLNDDHHLVIAGSAKFTAGRRRFDNPAYREQLESLAHELGVSHRVRYLGERPDVAGVMRALDLLLLPSWEEPLGRSMLEAMAVGVPVLATSIGGPREVLQGDRGGRTIDPYEPDAWARAIRELADDPALRETLSARGIETARGEFTPERHVQLVRGAYERALELERARPGTTRVRRGMTPLSALAADDGDAPGRIVKVLYVDHTSLVSGAQRALLDLIGGLPDSVVATVMCPEGRLADMARILAVGVVQFPGTSGSLRLHPWYTFKASAQVFRSGLAIRRAAASTEADLIHANSIRAGLMVAIARALGGPPTVVHIHDVLPATRSAALVRRLVRSNASAIITVSNYTTGNFMGRRSAKGAHMLHNPLDVSRFDPSAQTRREARIALGIAEEEKLVGLIAQITPWKGHDTAVRAMAVLRRSHPDARLLLVGEAKFVSKETRFDNVAFERELHELVERLDLGACVEFLGEREDVTTIMRALDIVVAPSWEEPFGRSVIEAMAMRTPVVATDVGGPGEYIEDGTDGFVLPPREPERWAATLERLFDDPSLRERLALNASRKVSELFARDAYVAKVLGVYQEVMDGRHAISQRARPAVARRR